MATTVLQFPTPVALMSADEFGEKFEQTLRVSTVKMGRECKKYPDADTFKVLRPERARGVHAWKIGKGIALAAKDSTLPMRAWNEFKAEIIGLLDSLVTPIPTSFHAAHLVETRADGEADVAKIEAAEAIRTGNVSAMQDCACKIRNQIYAAQQLAALLDQTIIATKTAHRGHWA